MLLLEFQEFMESEIENLSCANEIKEAMAYSLISNGKCIRPLVFLRLLKTSKYTINEYKLAMAIECVHTYSLIHDDLPAMDNDDYRRGKLTSHKKFGENLAILAGDALLTLAFELISSTSYESDKIVKLVSIIAINSGVNGGMINGQVLDILEFGKNGIDSINQIHFEKTAKLIQVPIIFALVVDDRAKDISSGLKLGELIGIMYQIQDDYLDFYGDEKTLGKDIGSDFENGKLTYVNHYTKTELELIIQKYHFEILELIENLGVGDEFLSLIKKIINRNS